MSDIRYCEDGHFWDCQDHQAAATHAGLHDGGGFRNVTLKLIAGVGSPDGTSSIGQQTLRDMEFGPAEPQLLPPFLSPDGVTILYGPGGVGKGMLSLFFVWMLVKLGKHVMVLDYEHHEREWARRARSMGFSDDELALVEYRAPFGDEWTAKQGSLQEVASLIRADCDMLGVEYVVIDSYTTATSTGDSMGGAASAQEFYEGIRSIGLPALCIAHVAGASARFPTRPFGSVFVHNLARETWAVESVERAELGVDVEYDHDTDIFQPKVLKLELRNMKMNVGERPSPQFVEFSFNYDGSIDVTRPEPPKVKLAEKVADVLSRSQQALSASAIVKALKSDFDIASTERIVRTVIGRESKWFKRNDVTPFTYERRA